MNVDKPILNMEQLWKLVNSVNNPKAYRDTASVDVFTAEHPVKIISFDEVSPELLSFYGINYEYLKRCLEYECSSVYAVDITKAITAQVSLGSLNVIVSNALSEIDPFPGCTKELYVEFRLNGVEGICVTQEFHSLVIPKNHKVNEQVGESELIIKKALYGCFSWNVKAGENVLLQALHVARYRNFVTIDPLAGEKAISHNVFVSPTKPWPVTPVYGYRFTGKKVFYRLFIGHASPHDLGIYFPEMEILITKSPVELARHNLDNWRSYILNHWSEVCSSLRHTSMLARPAVLVMNKHFAHNYWNELSVIEALVQNKLHRHVEYYCRISPLGKLTELFEDIPEGLVHYVPGDMDNFYSVLLNDRVYPIPCGRINIPKSLRDRVLNYSKKRHPTITPKTQTIRESSFPIFWISLRTDSRIWINQHDGLIQLLNALFCNWPNMAVLFDGTSYPEYVQAGEQTNSERCLLTEISKHLTSGMIVHDLLGITLNESFLWMQAADIYITPHGTIQHKVGWFTNIPGIVHCGENLRKQVNNKHFATFYAAEGSKEPSYVFGKVVRDDTCDARSDMMSYELDWREIYDKITQLVIQRREK